MKRAQFTNVGACLITIGGTRFVPGDTSPERTTIPSDQTVATWTRDLTFKLSAEIKAELEAQKVPASELEAKIQAALPKRLEKALDAKAEALLTGVRAAPVVRAKLLKEGTQDMPAPKPDPVHGHQNLTELEPLQALAAIRLCTDVNVLNRWLDGENRDAIKQAIVRRAEELVK